MKEVSLVSAIGLGCVCEEVIQHRGTITLHLPTYWEQLGYRLYG